MYNCSYCFEDFNTCRLDLICFKGCKNCFSKAGKDVLNPKKSDKHINELENNRTTDLNGSSCLLVQNVSSSANSNIVDDKIDFTTSSELLNVLHSVTLKDSSTCYELKNNLECVETSHARVDAESSVNKEYTIPNYTENEKQNNFDSDSIFLRQMRSSDSLDFSTESANDDCQLENDMQITGAFESNISLNLSAPQSSINHILTNDRVSHNFKYVQACKVDQDKSVAGSTTYLGCSIKSSNLYENKPSPQYKSRGKRISMFKPEFYSDSSEDDAKVNSDSEIADVEMEYTDHENALNMTTAKTENNEEIKDSFENEISTIEKNGHSFAQEKLFKLEMEEIKERDFVIENKIASKDINSCRYSAISLPESSGIPVVELSISDCSSSDSESRSSEGSDYNPTNFTDFYTEELKGKFKYHDSYLNEVKFEEILKTGKGKKSYYCKKCNITFFFKSRYKHHVQTHGSKDLHYSGRRMADCM